MMSYHVDTNKVPVRFMDRQMDRRKQQQYPGADPGFQVEGGGGVGHNSLSQIEKRRGLLYKYFKLLPSGHTTQ